MSTNDTGTNETGQPVDWFDMMETEFIRHRDAGLNHHAALIAAFDTVRLRREIAGRTLRFVQTPAEPVEDVNGIPSSVTEAVFEQTRFSADDLGEIEPAWIGDRR